MKNIVGILILVLILLPFTLVIISTIMGIDLMGSFEWLGDEIGFVFIMVLWTYITGYLAWNWNKKAFEFETENPLKKSRDLGFFVTLGVGYSLVCIAFPVWISQGPFQTDEFEQFLVLVLLAFVVLGISIYLNNYAKKKCAKQITKRMVFLRRMALIHIWPLGVILILALLFILWASTSGAFL